MNARNCTGLQPVVAFKQFITLFSVSILCAAGPVQSQTEEENLAPWYQIELVVFSQTLNSQDTSEAWPTDIALAYPPGTVTLIDPNAPEEPDLLEEETSSIRNDELLTPGLYITDEASRPRNTPEIPPLLEQSENDTEEISIGDRDALATDERPLNAEQSTELSASNQTGESVLSADTTELPIGPVPYTLLDVSELTLLEAVERLSRNNQRRVLQHLAWRQPVDSKEQASAVVLTGGDKFDQHFELEGSVTLHVSRYLHFSTNLWLTQFYPNFGQSSGYTEWPHLPPIPKGLNTYSALRPNEISIGDTEINPLSSTTDTIDYSIQVDFDSAALTGSFGNFNDTIQSENYQEPTYIVDNIILNRQSRRMRSGEIHYLDHPILGVIVKVTPWEAPTEESTNVEPADVLAIEASGE